MPDETADAPHKHPSDLALVVQIGVCVAISLCLHAGIIALALMRLAEDAGVAERPPSIVSVAQQISETIDAVAQSESSPESGGAAGEPPVAEPVTPEELPAGEQEVDELVDERPPAPAEPMQDPAEAALPAQAALPEPPVESVTATVPAPEAAEKPVERSRPEKARKPEPRNDRRLRKPADAESKPDPRQQAGRDAKKKREAQKRAAALEKANKPAHEGGKPGRQGRDQGRAGRASASAGSMADFAARVRAAVARRKPGGRGATGTAVVSFSLTSGGSLAGARLARSSGNPALDNLALGAVRGAAFPRPPAGATRGQLSFTIPFYFR